MQNGKKKWKQGAACHNIKKRRNLNVDDTF